MGARILVVDDEQLYRHLLRVNLETEGYEVASAVDGEQALEMISMSLPDLVILDVAMPRLDGIATCERIRQFSEVPVIMLTAKGEEQDRVRGLNVGADDYVIKPFSATELVARVRAVLRRTKTSTQWCINATSCIIICVSTSPVRKYGKTTNRCIYQRQNTAC